MSYPARAVGLGKYDDPFFAQLNSFNYFMQNKFIALQELTETPTPNDKYENFINTHMEAAAEYTLTELRVKHRGINSLEKRDNVNTASLCNKRNSTNFNLRRRYEN